MNDSKSPSHQRHASILTPKYRTWINRITIQANLELQPYLIGLTTATHRRDTLATLYRIPFFYQQLAIVCVGRDVVITMANHNQVAIFW